MLTTLPVIEPTTSRLPTPSGELDTREIQLLGEPRGLVLLLCAAGRLSIDACETMNAFAEHGYATVAVDLVTNGGEDDNAVVENLRAVVDRALDEGWEPEQIGLVGYRAGGHAALLGAMTMELGAAVSVSPTDIDTINLSSQNGDMRTPWLGMFGNHDPSVSPAQILTLHGQLRSLPNAFVSVVSYSAGFDFFRDSGDPSVHAVAFDSWQRTVEWLNLRVAPRLTPLALAWREKTSTQDQQPIAQPEPKGDLQ
ncbi:dienelactone hydrolase family protein [Rhodococcus sp. MSC1_016]|jgi:carboxymethylenebutenolidase|uniref:dienelactone hydrolase family protein n=1 Tax=Rhodococcus sp. MSC1_016 TaxID=2909266 RepID=UPI00202E3662|nr:dienelactone hydrolase family protein [Rhodococcus sp. MSC1_016]